MEGFVSVRAILLDHITELLSEWGIQYIDFINI